MISAEMLKSPLLCLSVCLLLTGCGANLAGTYTAQAEANGTPTHTDPGYSMEEIKGKLTAEPRTIELNGDGTFKTTAGGRVVWEGKWRAEGDNVILRTEKTGGTALTKSLQDEKTFPLKDGAIYDDASYGVYAVRLVYKKK